MKLLNIITDYPNQNIVVVLDDGTKVSVTLRYSANQKGWFYTVIYGEFISYNRRLIVNPNMLRQFREIIPFGLACNSSDGYEPIMVDDFVTKRVRLYLLTASDVSDVESAISTAKGTYA